MEDKFAKLRAQVEAPWRAPFGQPWKVPAHQALEEEKLQQFHDYLTKFHIGLEAWKNSDFARDGHSLFKRLTAQVDGLRATLREHCDAARTRAIGELVASLVLAGLTVKFSKQLLPVVGPIAVVFALVKLSQSLRRRLAARTSVAFKLAADGRALPRP